MHHSFFLVEMHQKRVTYLSTRAGMAEIWFRWQPVQ